jgi:tRNA(Ile)-lysidine synthase
MNAPKLVHEVEKACQRLGVAADAGLVLAVSGGPDSVALLRAALALPGSTSYIVAHFNHQLRGAESDGDEAFVRELVAMWRGQTNHPLEFRVERADIRAAAAKHRDNLEAIARRVRYDWLRGAALDHGLAWIATGHTADDQAETVLHRLLRGAGLKGLRGIAQRRELAAGVAVIRPMLTVTRQDVLTYLEAERQTFREDSTNFELTYTRNRLRRQLLPMLAEHYNPEIRGILCRLAEQAEDAFAMIDTAARALLREVEKPYAGSFVILDRGRLRTATPYLVCELFRTIWEREGWPQRGMHHEHWQRLAALARGEAPSLHLPGGIEARAREWVVQVGPAP